MTVAELSERMSSAELTEWMALDLSLDPLPNEWRQTGVIASAVVSPYVTKGKPPRPEDFMPLATTEQTPEDFANEIHKLKQLNRKQAKQ